MELTEEKIFAAFGLEQPGENEPETAEPADADTVQPPAEEDAESVESGGDGGETAEEQSPTEEAKDGAEDAENGAENTESAPQSLAERRRNAARRRERERQEAIDAALKAARERWQQERERERQEFFRRAQLTDPVTKKPITSMEEFNAWRQARDDAQLQQELQSGKLTAETLRSMVQEAVQQTRDESALTPEQPKAEEEEREREMREQLEDIYRAEPQIKEPADLMKQPWSQAFYEAVQRGNSFRDAYYLATREQREREAGERAQLAAQRAAEEAKAEAVRGAQGKEHLKRTGALSKRGADVSKEERKFYRLFNEGVTDEQIQSFANRQRV